MKYPLGKHPNNLMPYKIIPRYGLRAKFPMIRPQRYNRYRVDQRRKGLQEGENRPERIGGTSKCFTGTSVRVVRVAVSYTHLTLPTIYSV